MPRQRTYALLSLLALVGFSIWAIRAMQPPTPLPANAPSTEFSAQRAFAHVQQMGREPHAMGTAAHAQVRSYLIDQVSRLGLEPVVQETPIAYRRPGRVGYIYNVMARLRGQRTGPANKAVLMLAHYDSQPNARGAADDGSSVAEILETARALKAGPPLQNDVIFLITDGEEYGLLGATAFLRHPWAKDVGFVMNLEARGVRGTSLTFEISPENGWAVEAFGKVAPYPAASSLMYEIYRSLPNSSDFTIFRNAGYTGLNSAYIDGFAHYHKLTDSPENLDLGSVQQQGSNLLALTRYLGNQSLTQTKAPDKMFFNPVGFWFVQYAMVWNAWLFGLLTILLVVTFLVGVGKGLVRIRQSLASMVLFLLIAMLVIALFWPITVAVRGALPPAFSLRVAERSAFAFDYYINGIYGSDHFLVAYALLTVGLFGLCVWLVCRWVRHYSLLMGTYLLLYVLTGLALVKLPSATYLFLFPLLFSVLGTWVVFRFDFVKEGPAWRLLLVTLLAALPTLAMLMPLVRLFFVTFDLQMPISGAMLLLSVTLGILLPIGYPISSNLRWRNVPLLPVGALIAGLVVTGWAIRAEQPSAEQPLHSMVSYYLDADTGKAYWASASPKLDHWKQQFFPTAKTAPFTEFYPAGQRLYSITPPSRLVNDAPTVPISAPTATVLSDSSNGTDRTLRLRLKSERGAAHVDIQFVSPDSNAITTLTINNEQVVPTRLDSPQGYHFQVLCSGLPVSKELAVTLRTRRNAPLRLLLFDESLSLPTSLIKIPRPNDVVFEQGAGSNQTIVRKTYSF